MIKHNQDGNVLLTVILGLLAVCFLAFGLWAYAGRQDYKNNVDAKVAVAVDAAKKQEDGVKDLQFAQEEKNPLKTYVGPQDYGSITIQYPKTWSGYIDQSGGTALLAGYFNPDVVPTVSGQSSVFALRVQVVSGSYSQVVNDLTSQQQAGKLQISPYFLPNVPKQIGIKASGTFSDTKQGTSVYLPLRDKTLIISTDGQQFLSDYNDIILKNFSFSP